MTTSNPFCPYEVGIINAHTDLGAQFIVKNAPVLSTVRTVRTVRIFGVACLESIADSMRQGEKKKRMS